MVTILEQQRFLKKVHQYHVALESRIIRGVGIIGELDIVIIINNRGAGLHGVEKIV